MYKFGVIRTLTRDAQIFVSGSVKELGCWNPKASVPLNTSTYVLHEPSFWTVDIEIEGKMPFEYKFLAKCPDGAVEWEGCGSGDNRSSAADGEEGVEAAPNGSHLLTPSWWKETLDQRSELHHTTAFYYNRVVCGGQGMHFCKVLDRFWLGSCPRQANHLFVLKALGIDTIMSFQTEADINNNCSGVLSYDDLCSGEAVIDRLEAAYRKLGMAFVWLPATDMSTPARRRMLPEAVFLLKTLLDNGRRVYVHCNAGIGRAGAVAAAFLMYVKGMTMKEMMYYLYDKRPAVYIDREALIKAKGDFLLKYCTVIGD